MLPETDELPAHPPPMPCLEPTPRDAIDEGEPSGDTTSGDDTTDVTTEAQPQPCLSVPRQPPMPCLTPRRIDPDDPPEAQPHPCLSRPAEPTEPADEER